MHKNVRVMASNLACIFGLAIAAGAPAMAAPRLLNPQAVIRIAGGGHGIDFDDIGYFPSLNKVSIPAGQTGSLVLLNPTNGKLAATYRVATPAVGMHGREQGTSSAAYGDGYIFASDHGQSEVAVLDAHNGNLLTRVKLASEPDYVRYLPSAHELWVTEPRAQQIQVFKVAAGAKPVVTPETTIPVKGGPETLVFDVQLDRGYANLWEDKTVVIDLKTHKVMTEWNNSCKGPRGLALDAANGFLFVGCTEGKVAVLDVNKNGRVLANAPSGAGIDIINYNPRLRHLYVPGSRSATMSIFKVSTSGSLQLLAEYRTVKGSHCVTDDGNGRIFVCDPHAGTILEIKDQ